MRTRKKGQSTLEYIILVTAVVVIILAYMGTTGVGSFQWTVNSMMKNTADKMPLMLEKMKLPRGN